MGVSFLTEEFKSQRRLHLTIAHIIEYSISVYKSIPCEAGVIYGALFKKVTSPGTH